MARIEIYCGGFHACGEYTVPGRGDVGADGVTAMLKGVVERDGLFRVVVGDRLICMGAGAVGNSVVVFEV